jgi:hypothetical protein
MTRPSSPSDFTADNVKIFFAVNFQLDDETVGFWTGYGDLTFGGVTYTGAGELLSFSEIKEDNQIGANGITVILAGLDATSADLGLDQSYQYRKAELYTGSLNNYPTVQSYKVFSGLIDRISITDGPEDSTVSIFLENRLIDLDRPRVFHYTNEEQKAFSPSRTNPPGSPLTGPVIVTDAGLSEIGGIQDKQIVWKAD